MKPSNITIKDARYFVDKAHRSFERGRGRSALKDLKRAVLLMEVEQIERDYKKMKKTMPSGSNWNKFLRKVDVIDPNWLERVLSPMFCHPSNLS